MRTITSSILLLASLQLVAAEPPPISIIPVPSYIPSIIILPPAESTAVYVSPPLTIVPEPDMLAASSVVVVLPAVSTLVGDVESTAAVEGGFTSTTTVPGGVPTQAPPQTSTTTIPLAAVNPVATSMTTILTTLPTPMVAGTPTGTGKNVTSGPIETSGGEGRGGNVVKMMSLALVGVMGVFVFA